MTQIENTQILQMTSVSRRSENCTFTLTPLECQYLLNLLTLLSKVAKFEFSRTALKRGETQQSVGLLEKRQRNQIMLRQTRPIYQFN